MSVYSYYPLRTDATWSPISSKTASDYLQESRQLRQSLAALEWRNFSLCQARRQIVYQRRLHLGDERFSLGRFGLYVEPQQRPHHLDCNFRIAMRLDRGHPWLPRKKQYYELLSERLLDIGCGIGRARRVHEPDDGRMLLDGPYCHIEKLIHETTRRCLCTHGDQAGPELLQLLAILGLDRPRHDVFVGKKLVERSDRRSGTLRDIAHRCRLKSHLGEDRGGRFQQPRHPFFSPLLYRNASGRKFGLLLYTHVMLHNVS